MLTVWHEKKFIKIENYLLKLTSISVVNNS